MTERVDGAFQSRGRRHSGREGELTAGAPASMHHSSPPAGLCTAPGSSPASCPHGLFRPTAPPLHQPPREPKQAFRRKSLPPGSRGWVDLPLRTEAARDCPQQQMAGRLHSGPKQRPGPWFAWQKPHGSVLSGPRLQGHPANQCGPAGPRHMGPHTMAARARRLPECSGQGLAHAETLQPDVYLAVHTQACVCVCVCV